MTKLDFVNLVTETALVHGITSEESFFLIAKSEKVNVDLDPVKKMGLYNLGLLKSGEKVNDKLLFKDYKLFANESDTVKESQVCISMETLMEMERLFKILICEEHSNPEYIEAVAKRYMKGDITAARYFVLFQGLFPVKHRKTNKKWNAHFGITFEGVSRQDRSNNVVNKFREIYRRKLTADRQKFDFGYFIIGTYLYIKESVSEENEDCYCLKPNKYLNLWQENYTIAEEFMEAKLAKASKKSGTAKSEGVQVYGM